MRTAITFLKPVIIRKTLKPMITCLAGVWILGLLPCLVFAEKPEDIIEKAQQAHGGQWKSGKIKDWIGLGKITIVGDSKSSNSFKILSKDKDKIQRLVDAPDGQTRNGSNGARSWQSSSFFSAEASGWAEYFIGSQTYRSVPSLFDYATKKLKLYDKGSKSKTITPKGQSYRVIEAEELSGRKTQYYIDEVTSMINCLEFDTGLFYSIPFDSRKYPLTASFVFSDYRDIDKVQTPFKIEVYVGFTKIETMTFNSVQYNTGLKDQDFNP